MSRASERVRTEGVALHVARRGEGRPLLLLHGFTGGGDSLGPIADHFAATRHTIAPDLVGHGQSDAPREVAPYTMQACVAQLVGVLDTLTIPRADVFGYSMGGRTALALCAAHPTRIGRVVLVGASAGLATAAERDARIAQDAALADRIERDGVTAFARSWARIPLFESQQRRLSETERAAAARTREANTAHGLANSLRGMGTGTQPPLHEALPRIETPVLALAGADDAKFRGIAETLAHALPNGRVQVIPDAGHAAHLEAPQATAAAALEFLDASTVSADVPTPSARVEAPRSP